MFRKGFLQYGKLLRTQRNFFQESFSLSSHTSLNNSRFLFFCQEKSIQSRMSSYHYHSSSSSSCSSIVDDSSYPLGREEEYMNMLEDSRHYQQYPEIAKNIFSQIKNENGNGMTVDTATSLIEALSSRSNPFEAIQVLRYCREMGVRPRINGYSSLIAGCYKANQFTQALQVFEVMRNDGFVPKNVTYSRVLSSALKSNQHQLVLEIFDDMLRHKVDTSIIIYNNILNSCARVGDIDSAMGVFKAIRERKMQLTSSTYHSLIICAGKTGHGSLALQFMKDIQKDGFECTMTVYNSVITACAKERKWSDIVHIYENILTKDEQNLLKGAYLGAVLMAHAKAENNPSKNAYTIELFEKKRLFYQQLTLDEKKRYFGETMDVFLNTFAYNSVLQALEQQEKYQEMIDFALKDMKQRDQMKWDEHTWTKMIFAHFFLGQIQKGKKMLLFHSKKMKKSTHLFRFLIDLYTKQQNYREACRMSMHMMHCNQRLSRLDWIHALENAIALKDWNLYWAFRDWMKIRARNLLDIPSHLMLEEAKRPLNYQQKTLSQQLNEEKQKQQHKGSSNHTI
jgi:pentatricopeptide repeat protein